MKWLKQALKWLKEFYLGNPEDPERKESKGMAFWHKYSIPITAVVVLSALIFAVLVPYARRQTPALRGETLATSIALDASGFEEFNTVLLTGAHWLNESQVRDGLTITPAKDFTVTALGEDTFEISIPSPGKDPLELVFTEPYGGNKFSIMVNYLSLQVEFVGLNPDNFDISDLITLRLSDTVELEALQEHLSIEPYTPFEMFFQDNLAYLRLDYPLQYNTHYTITVSKGLVSMDDSQALLEDVHLSFDTQKKGFSVSMSNAAVKMLTQRDTVELTFDTMIMPNQPVESASMEVALYQFATLDDYLKWAEKYSIENVDLSSLKKLSSQTHELEASIHTVTLENPGIGGYLVVAETVDPISGDVYRFRKAFCVTDLSVYAQTSGTKTLVWVNNSVTGEPLPGYEVEFRYYNRDTVLAGGTTGADGVTVLRCEGDREDRSLTRVITLKDPDGKLVYVDNTNVLNRYNSGLRENRFYSFFMLDRPIYRPTDEINFWGFVRAWSGNTGPRPQTVTVTLGEGYLDQTIELPVQPDGTFQGRLTLEQVRSSHYELSVRLADVPSSYDPEGKGYTLAYEYVQVKDYQKPMYVINVDQDKEFYRPGEDVTLSVSPTFYDGTPMPYFDMELMLRSGVYGEYGDAIKITTDARGVATHTFPANQKKGRSGWLPATGGYMVKISEDGENIEYRDSYRYLPADTMVAGRVEEVAGTGKLRLQMDSALVKHDHLKTLKDLDSIQSNDYWDTYGYNDTQTTALKGASKDVDVAVTVQYSYYEEVQVWRENSWSASSQYTNTWEQRSGSNSYNIRTKDGTFTLDDLTDIPYDYKHYFSLDVTLDYTDAKGTPCSSSFYWYNDRRSPEEGETRTVSPGFHFAVRDAAGKNKLGEYRSYMTYDEASFGDGETMHFSLLYQGEPVANKGRILYSVIQGEIEDHGITNQNSLLFTQKIANANSVNVVAAYFDGTTVWPIRNTIISFNKESITLNVEVTPDKETYGPGDKVTLNVKVTDAAGKGVAGTTCLSIVDEAVFALQEQYITALSDLYADFYFDHYHIPKYATGKGDFTHEYGMGDGGKGDGGDISFLDNLRKNFRDTALFRAVRTNADGVATTTFTLPDNVTSWRITGVSIGDNLYAGQSKANFISTQPFFVSPVISTKYIDGDDIAMLVQGHGVALNQKSKIAYTVNIKGDGVNETRKVENLAYRSNQINFGKLPQGEYTVTVSAKTGTYSDAVELPLAVINSNLELVINKVLDLSKPFEVNAVRYPVTLTFYDKNHGAYYDSVSSLLTHYCMWSSQRMSRFVAKRALSQYMEPDQIPMHIRADANAIASDMQNPDGGIGSAPGNPSDPVITTKVLIVAKDQFNLNLMADYFEGIIDSNNKNPDTLAACYLGLAVTGRDVYSAVMERFPTASPSQKGYYIAALTYLGRETEALALYGEHIAPNMVDAGLGRHYKSTDGATAEKIQANIQVNTAGVWIAASCLHHPDADAISTYFAQACWRINTLFEAMIYVTHYDKEVIATGLTYSVNGKETKMDLGLWGQRSLVLNKSQLASFKLVDVPENLVARAYFIGEPSEVDITPSDSFTIEKTIEEISKDRYKITLTLNFKADAPLGMYDISDWVPSNMRLYSIDRTNRGEGSYWWYTFSTEGQKLYTRIYRSEKTNKINLQYTTQRTYDAEAVFDSAYAIHGETGDNNLTPRSVLK